MRYGWWMLGVAALLSACGGGGGGSESVTPPPPAPPVVPPLSSQCEMNSVARFDTEALSVGRSAELHLLACGGGLLSRLQWAGPAGLPLLSARSQSLSFTPAQAGAQRFTVNFVDAQGRNQSGSVELQALASSESRGLLTRGEPSAWSGDRLSLRAWPQGISDAELVGASWRWTRVSGPELSLGDAEQARLLLSAPTVTEDRLLVLRATLSLASGASYSDEFRLLVQPVPAPARCSAAAMRRRAPIPGRPMARMPRRWRAASTAPH